MAKKTKKAQTVKVPETYEEFLEQEWAQHRTWGSGYQIPPCNYPFRVGQPVRAGGHEEVRVEGFFEDGRLVHISYHDRGVTYGKPWDLHRRRPKLVWWINLEPLEDETETAFYRERIRTNYYQQHLSSLMHTVYARGLITSPDYQREYVWTLEDKQRLVKSIFDRADIGKFVFMEHPHHENRLEVIDGKQRLNAIQEFMEGRFAYEGKTWFQLSWKDKRAFGDIMVQLTQLDAEQVKRSDVLWLFLSLNRGGVPQTDEHIAKIKTKYEAALAAEAE